VEFSQWKYRKLDEFIGNDCQSSGVISDLRSSETFTVSGRHIGPVFEEQGPEDGTDMSFRNTGKYQSRLFNISQIFLNTLKHEFHPNDI